MCFVGLYDLLALLWFITAPVVLTMATIPAFNIFNLLYTDANAYRNLLYVGHITLIPSTTGSNE